MSALASNDEEFMVFSELIMLHLSMLGPRGREATLIFSSSSRLWLLFGFFF